MDWWATVSTHTHTHSLSLSLSLSLFLCTSWLLFSCVTLLTPSTIAPRTNPSVSSVAVFVHGCFCFVFLSCFRFGFLIFLFFFLLCCLLSLSLSLFLSFSVCLQQQPKIINYFTLLCFINWQTFSHHHSLRKKKTNAISPVNHLSILFSKCF